MVRRPKPQDWKPKRFEAGWEIDRLYKQKIFAGIVKEAGLPNRVARECAFRDCVLDAARWLYIDRSYELRPTEKQISTALETLSKKIGAVRETLKNLDADSKVLLSVEFQALRRNIEQFPSGPAGSEPLVEVDRILRCLDESTYSARQQLKRPQKGPPRKDAIVKAVAKLAQQYPNFSGGKVAGRSVNSDHNEVTGEFGRFAKEALRPVLELTNEKVTNDAIKRALRSLKKEKPHN